MLPNRGLLDAAIVTRLSGDATLAGLLPDGVHYDVAPQGKRKFAIVSLVFGRDVGRMGNAQARRATEEIVYLVKAVTLDPSRAGAYNAAARIDQLLEDAPLVVAGYGPITVARVEPIVDTEVDQVDATIRWQHIGGRYRMLAIPA